jgi:outer membrane protein assembly factor BamE (lipoprotein component of BamABCDE complex)
MLTLTAFTRRATRVWVLVAILLAAATGGCSSTQHSEEPAASKSGLTPGGVKLNLEKGKTKQQDVLNAFGTPDLVTHKDGQDIWTYDKTSYDYEKRSDYATLILIGQGGDRVRSSSHSTMLIVYFDQRETVTDYRLSAIKY